jgi:hypothetical protein
MEIIPITKPEKENSTEVSKFRPITLINAAGKVLEKLQMKRILHNIYSNNLMNPNQYGFTPKRNATNAALAIKEYIKKGMREGHITILISLDVKVHSLPHVGSVY